MGQFPYKDEEERRIGEFLIEFNILSSEQVMSILINNPVFRKLRQEKTASDIVISQIIDLSN